MFSFCMELHSQFKIIASCLIEGFGEIWRIVERATCTGGVTVFTIPESVIGVEAVLCSIISVPRIHVLGLTEVIFSNQWWDWYNTTNVTWTVAAAVL